MDKNVKRVLNAFNILFRVLLAFQRVMGTENESNNSDRTENESNSSDRTLASCENTNKRQKRKFKESNPAKRKHTALTVNQKLKFAEPRRTTRA